MKLFVSIETDGRTNLTEQAKIKLNKRLNKITKIENYFYEEINERKLCSKKMSKYIAAFDYIDTVLIALSAASGGVSIISFTSVAGAPVGIASASFPLIFSLTTGIVKKLLSICWYVVMHVLMLAKSKLNSIETLISQALIDMEISHVEFTAIFKEKDLRKRKKT